VKNAFNSNNSKINIHDIVLKYNNTNINNDGNYLNKINSKEKQKTKPAYTQNFIKKAFNSCSSNNNKSNIRDSYCSNFKMRKHSNNNILTNKLIMSLATENNKTEIDVSNSSANKACFTSNNTKNNFYNKNKNYLINRSCEIREIKNNNNIFSAAAKAEENENTFLEIKNELIGKVNDNYANKTVNNYNNERNNFLHKNNQNNEFIPTAGKNINSFFEINRKKFFGAKVNKYIIKKNSNKTIDYDFNKEKSNENAFSTVTATFHVNSNNELESNQSRGKNFLWNESAYYFTDAAAVENNKQQRILMQKESDMDPNMSIKIHGTFSKDGNFVI